mmetsp:Transcript_120452/g.300496  ORF Transcript_120452/g.300496 Transcript_120452/m.300496 type:complete len:216 (+) Transcript_120452:321-968(+)
MVHQPSEESPKARTLIRWTGSSFVSFGPIMISTTSPFSKSLNGSPLSPLTCLSSGTSSSTVKCFVLSLVNTEPALPFGVIQPSLPSFRAWPRTRRMPESPASTGPSKMVKTSPTASFLTILPFFTSKSSVMATTPQQTWKPPTSANTLPALLRTVKKPCTPSLTALPFALSSGCRVSFRGPSRSSRSSSGLNFLTRSAEAASKPLCSSMARLQTK